MVGWIGNWLGHTDKEEEVARTYTDRYSNDPVWSMTCSTTEYFSTGVPTMGPMFRTYVEKEVEDPACPYCGNLSKLRDPRGNCIACGGSRR